MNQKQTNNLQLTEVWLNEGEIAKTGVDDVEGEWVEKLPLIGLDVREGTTVVSPWDNDIELEDAELYEAESREAFGRADDPGSVVNPDKLASETEETISLLDDTVNAQR
jgi:hypothetical protein